MSILLDAPADIFDALSNVELSVVLDGGSAHVVAIAPSGHEYDAYVDLDGLCLADGNAFGYVLDPKGWKLDRPY